MYIYYILDRELPGFLPKINLVFCLRSLKDLSPKRNYIILAGTTLKLIWDDDWPIFFLGATLRDYVTSQSVRHHNKHSFI